MTHQYFLPIKHLQQNQPMDSNQVPRVSEIVNPSSTPTPQVSQAPLSSKTVPKILHPKPVVRTKYVDFIKIKQKEAQRKGQPVSDYGGYDPNRSKGEHIESSAPTDQSEYNAYRKHKGLPLQGPVDWPQYFHTFEDVGPQLDAWQPWFKPLLQSEFEFCKKCGIDIIRKLGKGAYGSVWRCQYNQKPYACKLIKLNMFKRFGMSSLRESVDRMLSEADVTEGLVHSNIVPVEHVFHIHDQVTGFPSVKVLLFMQLCDGDLRGLLGRWYWPNRFNEDQARAVMIDVCRGLKFLHDQHIVHLDIKPENILFTSNQNGERCFKLADFGLATKYDDEDTGIVTVGGTADYRAPELDKKGMTDAKKVDIFALGTVLIEMLVGDKKMLVCRQDFWSALSLEVIQKLADKWGLTLFAANLIRNMTRLDWINRPTIDQVILDQWFDQMLQMPGVAQWVDN